MKERFFSAIFSLNGLSLLIGVTGFVSSWVTLSVDLSLAISIKWFLALLVFFIFIAAILVKIIYDGSLRIELMPFEEQVIKYVESSGVLVIRKNETFTTGNVVGIYRAHNDVVSFICLGVVEHSQPKIIQIKPINLEGNILSSEAHNYVVSTRLKYTDVIQPA